MKSCSRTREKQNNLIVPRSDLLRNKDKNNGKVAKQSYKRFRNHTSNRTKNDSETYFGMNIGSIKRTMARKGQLTTTVCVQKEMKFNRKYNSIENDDSIGDDFTNKRNKSIKRTARDSIKKVPTETVLKSAKHRRRSTLIGRKKRFSGNESDSVNNCALNYTSTSVTTLAAVNGDFDYSNISLSLIHI